MKHAGFEIPGKETFREDNFLEVLFFFSLPYLFIYFLNKGHLIWKILKDTTIKN